MPKQRDAISSETAYLMVHMLKGALEEPGGTAQGLKRFACSQNNEIGAKTGTTSNQSDAWFMGITKNLVGGCWVGGDNRSIHFRSLALGQGARLAMPAWAMFMDKVYADPTIALKKEPFVKPASMTFSFDCSGYGGISDDSTAIIIPTQKPNEQNGLLQ
jgi:penicillin-binding protein 1A